MHKNLNSVLLLLAAFLASSCGNSEAKSYAARISSVSQRIGGPKALGDIGDYIIENDKVRFIIQGPRPGGGSGEQSGKNTSPLIGQVIDADLQRPRGSKDRGLDQLGEFGPMYLLLTLNPSSFEVTNDGSDGQAAVISVEGTAGQVFQLIATLHAGLVFPDNLRFRIDYILEPGTSYLRIDTTVTNISDSTHRFPFFDPPDLIDLGLDIPGLDSLTLSIPFGHYAIFGAEQKPFAPGRAGFDLRFTIEKEYLRAPGFPAFPGLVTDFIATKGDGVSYGVAITRSDNSYVGAFMNEYAEQGPKETGLLVPLTFSGLIPIYNVNPPAELASGDEFTYTAYLIVGNGDVASVAESVYELQEVDTGRFAGRVFDEQTGQPLEYASIVVSEASGDFVTQLQTDKGGRFQGRVPVGDYGYQVVVGDRFPTSPESISIRSGQTTSVIKQVEPPGRISLQITDANGRQIPCKVTLVGRFDPANQGGDPREFLYNLGLGESMRHTAFDDQRNEFIEKTWYTPNGLLDATVRPGEYELVVSRGMEYDLQIIRVAVESGTFIEERITLNQVVNTEGYISTDLHMHSENSVDSAMTLEDRVVSIAGEGVEFTAATDHNAVTDYLPAIGAMGLDQWLVASVGTETTTFEMGHFNGYPLRYHRSSVRGGDVFWGGRTPGEIFEQLRALGKYGPENTIVQVNHPRWDILGYFSQFNFDQETGEVGPKAGLAAVFAPFGDEFDPSNFSLEFDAIEILNGKRQDLVHTYRIPEVLPEEPIPDPATLPPAGSILRTADGEIAFPGALEDWFSLLNLGHRFVAVGASDSHRASAEAGFPRTYVWMGVGKDKPGAFSELDFVEALRSRRAVISMGAMAELFVDSQPIGSDVRTQAGSVEIEIRAQAPSWLQLNKAIVYANGEVIIEIDIPSGAANDFRETRTVNVTEDTWFVLEVTGPTNMFPVVTPDEFEKPTPAQIITALGVGFDLSALDPFGNLAPQEAQISKPQAITNPIWVDTDGNGTFDPPGVGPLNLRAAKAAKKKKKREFPDVRDLFRKMKERAQ